MVPWLRPFTAILTAGIPWRLSAVMTNPYTCTTESFSLSNCAWAIIGPAIRRTYSTIFFIRSTFIYLAYLALFQLFTDCAPVFQFGYQTLFCPKCLGRKAPPCKNEG